MGVCPEYTYWQDPETCIRICSHVHNGTCLSSCPAAAKYHAPDDPICYMTCPGNMVHLPNHTGVLTRLSRWSKLHSEFDMCHKLSGVGLVLCYLWWNQHVQRSYQYAINSTGCRTYCPEEKPYCVPMRLRQGGRQGDIVSDCKCVTSCEHLTFCITITCIMYNHNCPEYVKY